jgi:hypothetical protein
MPHLTKMVRLADTVVAANPGWLNSHEKRRFVIEGVQWRAQEIGHEAYDDLMSLTTLELERAIRVGIENVLHQINDLEVNNSEIDDMNDEEDELIA